MVGSSVDKMSMSIAAKQSQSFGRGKLPYCQKRECFEGQLGKLGEMRDSAHHQCVTMLEDAMLLCCYVLGFTVVDQVCETYIYALCLQFLFPIELPLFVSVMGFSYKKWTATILGSYAF